MNAASVVGTIIDGGDSQTLWAVKKYFKRYPLSGGGDAKIFAPIPSYLVKLSLSSIYIMSSSALENYLCQVKFFRIYLILFFPKVST